MTFNTPLKNKVEKLLVALAAILLPGATMAAESMAKPMGISDLNLLYVLVGIIVLLLYLLYAISNSIKVLARVKIAKNAKKTVEKTAMMAFFLFSANAASAATEVVKASTFVMTEDLFYVLISVIIFLVCVLLYVLGVFRFMVKAQNPEIKLEEETPVDIFKSLHLTDNVPIEKEDSVMMDHEYDGIRELDNDLPPWWKYMFYGTIIFAFVYIYRYHLGDGLLSQEEYVAEVVEAEALKAEAMASARESINEENVERLIDETALAEGAKIFKNSCATCHGKLGEGGAGPNMTDKNWIHGGGIKNVFNTIKYGVPEKGMIPWQDQLSPYQMQSVASYILGLEGTNPPNQKAPQGEVYTEETVADTTMNNPIDSTSLTMVSDTLLEASSEEK